MSLSYSIVIPARNEAASLSGLLPNLKKLCPSAELIIVDDGSTDNTNKLALQYSAHVVRHAQSLGNGAAIKSGARAYS